MSIPCPLCEEPVIVDEDIELSEVVVCSACDGELEVVSVDPVVLAEFEEEEK